MHSGTSTLKKYSITVVKYLLDFQLFKKLKQKKKRNILVKKCLALTLHFLLN